MAKRQGTGNSTRDRKPKVEKVEDQNLLDRFVGSKTGQTGLEEIQDGPGDEVLFDENNDGPGDDINISKTKEHFILSQYEENSSGYFVLKKEAESSINEVLFEINGFKARMDTCYQITGKMDYSAPAALFKNNSTKLLNPSIEDYMCFPLDEHTNSYDTGFYTLSPCYRGLDRNAIEKEMRLRIQNIKDPYEEIHGEGKLDHTNFDFYDTESIKCKTGEVLYTKNIEDLFRLYFLLLGKKVCPKDLENDPMYSQTLYCVEDSAEVKDSEEKVAKQRALAITNYSELLKSDFKRLVYILVYMGFPIYKEITESTLTTHVMNFINNDQKPENAEMFNEMYVKSLNSVIYEELKLHYLLMMKVQSNSVKLSVHGLSYKDTVIGPTVKDAARNIRAKNELNEIRKELLSINYI